MDQYAGTLIVGLVVGACLGAVLAFVLVFKAWQAESERRDKRDANLYARLATAELEVMRLTEEIDLAAVVSKALHPSAGLRPLGVVVSLDDRRGGA